MQLKSSILVLLILCSLSSCKQKQDKKTSVTETSKIEPKKKFDKSLATALDTIHALDQRYRKQFLELQKKYDMQSEEMINHVILMKQTDAANLAKVTKILDEKGWLGADVVGKKGNSALFLVIQHSNLETQVKYLPMLREAVKKGNADGSDLAMLEDRVAVNQGKKQVYGTQIEQDNKTGKLFVLPIIEPEKVNERRANVGLPAIEEYLKHFGLTWDVEAHKKNS